MNPGPPFAPLGSDTVHTTERLARAIQEAYWGSDSPVWLADMVLRAREGHYHPTLSGLPFPLMRIVRELEAQNEPTFTALADRIRADEFDATQAEQDAYRDSDEGRASLAELTGAPPLADVAVPWGQLPADLDEGAIQLDTQPDPDTGRLLKRVWFGRRNYHDITDDSAQLAYITGVLGAAMACEYENAIFEHHLYLLTRQERLDEAGMIGNIIAHVRELRGQVMWEAGPVRLRPVGAVSRGTGEHRFLVEATIPGGDLAWEWEPDQMRQHVAHVLDDIAVAPCEAAYALFLTSTQGITREHAAQLTGDAYNVLHAARNVRARLISEQFDEARAAEDPETDGKPDPAPEPGAARAVVHAEPIETAEVAPPPPQG